MSTARGSLQAMLATQGRFARLSVDYYIFSICVFTAQNLNRTEAVNSKSVMFVPEVRGGIVAGKLCLSEGR